MAKISFLQNLLIEFKQYLELINLSSKLNLSKLNKFDNLFKHFYDDIFGLISDPKPNINSKEICMKLNKMVSDTDLMITSLQEVKYFQKGFEMMKKKIDKIIVINKN